MSNIKPDLVLKRGILAVVVDPQVVSKQTDLKQAKSRKKKKYESLNDDVRARFNVQEVQFTTVTLSCRGVWSKESCEDLQRLGIIIKKDIKVLSTRVLVGAANIRRVSNQSTERIQGINRRNPHIDQQRDLGTEE